MCKRLSIRHTLCNHHSQPETHVEKCMLRGIDQPRCPDSQCGPFERIDDVSFCPKCIKGSKSGNPAEDKRKKDDEKKKKKAAYDRAKSDKKAAQKAQERKKKEFDERQKTKTNTTKHSSRAKVKHSGGGCCVQ